MSVWGGVLATLLAMVKLWEVFADRPRLTTDYSFSSSPGHDHFIVIANTSKTPALISFWELTWARRLLGLTLFSRFEAMPEDGRCDLTVPSHGRVTLSFDEERWFRTKSEIERVPVKLYLKVYLHGRRSPLWLRVWP